MTIDDLLALHKQVYKAIQRDPALESLLVAFQSLYWKIALEAHLSASSPLWLKPVCRPAVATARTVRFPVMNTERRVARQMKYTGTKSQSFLRGAHSVHVHLRASEA
ncbi:hypothetical protein OPT61_g4849 [Boeremia exigua]|uniref:Uncharacterized protein n=1 Tax=Boeremia exigua TaxID=749465 RepID=A0ACC2ICI4_9PLEO|nr:hypothetical protein OPT61_g4849 [Boeremia exigua]